MIPIDKAIIQRLAIGAPEPCCVYVENVLRAVYGSVVDAAPREWWRIIRDNPNVSGVSPWSPPMAAHRCGIGQFLGGGLQALPPIPERWHIVQGWRGTPFVRGVTGHTFLFYAGPVVGVSAGVIADCTETRGPMVRRMTWEQATHTFAAVGLTALRVA